MPTRVHCFLSRPIRCFVTESFDQSLVSTNVESESAAQSTLSLISIEIIRVHFVKAAPQQIEPVSSQTWDCTQLPQIMSGRYNRFLPAPPASYPEFVQSHVSPWQAKYPLLPSCHHHHVTQSRHFATQIRHHATQIRHHITQICHHITQIPHSRHISVTIHSQQTS